MMGVPTDQQEILEFEDDALKEITLFRLNTLRKNSQLCDVTLEVGAHEIKAHKAVLASASKYLFELFTMEEGQNVSHYKLNGFEYEHFDKLVNYAYTAKLSVPELDVKALYKTAMQLKMKRAAQACSQFLGNHLNPNNCIGIRSFASFHSDMALTDKTDIFIQENIDEVVQSNDLIKLPRVRIELIGVDTNTGTNEVQISTLVVDWTRRSLADNTELDSLTDHINVLYLTSDLTLRDCRELDDEDLNGTDIVVDYKKVSKKRQGNHTPSKAGGRRLSPGTSSQLAHVMGTEHKDIMDDTVEPKQWKAIATQKISDKSLMCIAILEDELAILSVHFRPTPVNENSDRSGANSPVLVCMPSRDGSLEKQVSLTPLVPMSSPRCSVGVCVVADSLLAVGGYDRGECLSTVEAYDAKTNKWSPLKSMKLPRGRFDVSFIGRKVYAIGGSSGQSELRSAEVYDSDTHMWEPIAELSSEKSSTGVASLNGCVYCVGGWNGVKALQECEMYDPNTNTWGHIEPLNTGRSQTGLCTLGGLLYAVGGCNAWTCHNTVEVYDPDTNVWTMAPPMKTCRRGAGVAVFNDLLYVIGGHDGSASLSTVEIYDPETETWSFGPNMTNCRANVGCAVMGQRLWAVGGFSGKAFLDSMEYLTESGEEWCTFMPVDGTSDGQLCLDIPTMKKHLRTRSPVNGPRINGNAAVNGEANSNAQTNGIANGHAATNGVH